MSQPPNTLPIIRELGEVDAEWMASLHSKAFAWHQRWDALAIRSLMAKPTTLSTGIAINNAWAGFIMTSFVVGESEILTIAIEPTQQRKGYAKLLIETFIAQQKSNGLEKIFLEVIETNIPAIKLYQSLGFSIISKRANYYAMPQGHEKQMVDALVLSKQLIG